MPLGLRLTEREARDIDVFLIESKLEKIRHEQAGLKNQRKLRKLEKQEAELVAIKQELQSNNFSNNNKPKKRGSSYVKAQMKKAHDDYRSH